MSDSEGTLNLYAEKCKKLLEESEIRFAGIVDKDGQLISGGFKEGLTPYEGDETRCNLFWILYQRHPSEKNTMKV